MVLSEWSSGKSNVPTDSSLKPRRFGRFLSENAKAQTNVTTDQFEIVYQGSRNDLTNAGDEETIVLRERQAWQNYDGKWGRIYGRQDGSALVRTMKDLDALEQWEKEHLRANSQP